MLLAAKTWQISAALKEWVSVDKYFLDLQIRFPKNICKPIRFQGQSTLYTCVLCLVIQSCLTLQPHGLYPARLLCPWDSPGKNTGVGCHALLQGIFPTQGSNPGLPHCKRILYQLKEAKPSKSSRELVTIPWHLMKSVPKVTKQMVNIVIYTQQWLLLFSPADIEIHQCLMPVQENGAAGFSNREQNHRQQWL